MTEAYNAAGSEPADLYSTDGRCPDLQLVLPGRNIISDVCVTHPLSPSMVKSKRAWTTTGAARTAQTTKRRKYDETAAQHRAELLPFCVETYGGMAPDAIKLLSAMGVVLHSRRCAERAGAIGAGNMVTGGDLE